MELQRSTSIAELEKTSVRHSWNLCNNFIGQQGEKCALQSFPETQKQVKLVSFEVPRTRISDRIKKLQELVPNMDKQTNTTDMLEEEIEYIKHLQKQIQESHCIILQSVKYDS
ncbi:transcription factor bHLH80-like [Macadamia integrifolia]|uniref:transcription factor bHLH80-like n=1 Tax=Macadamia integrifolia TaxID=60698 RepID=UPI001C4F591F|nr:transcription factor bHLH80-like [Macadamia integrifolia]